ncbi:unnamed protein product [Medioppia subpectinata]|uniref:Neurotransmitter-gated ion-channel ligand-binding domain-containing protein n=1 Tax=Medioppia subpectinata TaxID=1979941 RepID=A0A7R9KW08_9ACAR|nr:unnamed protein product [Medioppia subpectinata]CAG2109769.1 unnamed protein product [Medioppia subpectinata]
MCPMDLHHFPMDKQSCPLIFGSYSYPIDQIMYSWDKSPVSFGELSMSQFDLVTTPHRNGTVKFQRGNYSMLQLNFNLRRHVGYFLIQIYVPCSLIVVLSWGGDCSYATALDWFTIMCFLFVVFTLLEFAGVHFFTKVGTGEVPFVERMDEDWAQDQYEDTDNDNPLHIIAPPKAYQTDERKKSVNRMKDYKS